MSSRAGTSLLGTVTSAVHFWRSDRWLSVLPFAILLGIWWVISASGLVTPLTLPRPEAVYRELGRLAASGELWEHISVSMARILRAVAIGVGMGVGLGMVVSLFRRLGDFLMPLASFFNSMSGITWIPLAILWFGLGTAAVTFIIWNAIFFLVFFNTVLGVRSIPAVLEHAVRTLGGSRFSVIRHVFLPGALPSIIVGVRIGFSFGWRALVAAELIAATSGLGFLIYDAGNWFRTDRILAGILVIGSLWMLLDGLLLRPLERRTVERWGTLQSI